MKFNIGLMAAVVAASIGSHSARAQPSPQIEDMALPILKAVVETCPAVVRLNPQRAVEFRTKAQAAGFNKAQYAEVLKKFTANPTGECRTFGERRAELPEKNRTTYLIWAPEMAEKLAAMQKQATGDFRIMPGMCLTRKIMLGAQPAEIWTMCFRDEKQADFRIAEAGRPSKGAPQVWSRPTATTLTSRDQTCTIQARGAGKVELKGCEIAASYDVVSGQ